MIVTYNSAWGARAQKRIKPEPLSVTKNQGRSRNNTNSNIIGRDPVLKSPRTRAENDIKPESLTVIRK